MLPILHHFSANKQPCPNIDRDEELKMSMKGTGEKASIPSKGAVAPSAPSAPAGFHANAALILLGYPCMHRHGMRGSPRSRMVSFAGIGGLH